MSEMRLTIVSVAILLIEEFGQWYVFVMCEVDLSILWFASRQDKP